MTAEQTPLQAGSLRCVLDGADVRDLRIADQRVLTRVYIAVRDESWNTIPFEYVARSLEMRADRFDIELSCTVNAPPITAEWGVTIYGRASGQFRYAIRGQALSSFRFAKLGLNLHHPLPEYLGARYVARRGDKVAKGKISGLIEPQFFIDGKLTGMFMPYDELVLQTSANDEIVLKFSGDEFEMQDHRNWTDYNLKSYGTPLEVPLPLSAEPGQVIEQSVVVDMSGARRFHDRAVSSRSGHVARMAVDRSRVAQLPRLGSEFPDEVAQVSPATASLIKEIPLDYVRLNLDLMSDEGTSAVTGRARQIAVWERPIELVLIVSPGRARPEELSRLGHWLEDVRPRLERTVVMEGPRGFYVGRTTTPGEKVRAFREVIEAQYGPAILVSATEQYFAELNRWWPDLSGVDGVGYTICPQVHAADDISLMENTWGQADTVLTARARSGGRAVHVTSIEMIGKFGPYPAGIPEAPVLSAYGDERQAEHFAAAWMLSSLRQLVDSQAASATYFELAGERGLVHVADGEAEPVPVPAYRVLEAVLSWANGDVVRVGPVPGTEIPELGVVGLGAEWSDRTELLIANLGQRERHIELSGLAGDLVELSELVRGSSWAGDWKEMSPLSPAHPRGTAELNIRHNGVVRLRTV